jgi:tRNA(fMet)-specific endonuclease VapC
MSQRFLLDTNIISDLVKHPQGAVFENISRVGEENIFTSIVVACELSFSASKKGSEALTSYIESILDNIEVLPFEQPADEHYGNLRNALEKAGELIGPNDVLIAAHALALDAVVVTANLREFSRVPGLKVENWLD